MNYSHESWIVINRSIPNVNATNVREQWKHTFKMLCIVLSSEFLNYHKSRLNKCIQTCIHRWKSFASLANVSLPFFWCDDIQCLELFCNLWNSHCVQNTDTLMSHSFVVDKIKNAVAINLIYMSAWMIKFEQNLWTYLITYLHK